MLRKAGVLFRLVPGGSGVKILGLDVSTKTGWAIGTIGGEYERGVIQFKPDAANRFSRWQLYATHLSRLVVSRNVDVCFIEGYGYSNQHTLVPLVEIGSVLRMALAKHEIPWYEVAPTSLKKFVAGAGNVKKQMMLLCMYKHFGLSIEDDNEADAQGLAFFAEAALGHRRKLPASHYKPVEVFLKNNPLFKAHST